MPAESACPGPPQLERFLLGKSSDADAAELESHINACTTCQHSLQTLELHDPLAELACAGADAPDAEMSSRIVTLIDRLSQNFAAVETPTATGDAHELGPLHLEELLGPALEPGEIGRLGAYRILRLLSRGGMGIVFEAEDIHLRRLVALKIMSLRLAAHPAARQRFLREARAAAAIEHDHIVPIFQVGEDRQLPFLVMPLLKGETLSSRLERERRLPPGEAARIGREIAEGLAAAHARGLIHRDIKPANIWLEQGRGRVKILDFGIVRAAEAESEATAVCSLDATNRSEFTQVGTVLGTPAYMAPEQAQGGEIGARRSLQPRLRTLSHVYGRGAVPCANNQGDSHGRCDAPPDAARRSNLVGTIQVDYATARQGPRKTAAIGARGRRAIDGPRAADRRRDKIPAVSSVNASFRPPPKERWPMRSRYGTPSARIHSARRACSAIRFTGSIDSSA